MPGTTLLQGNLQHTPAPQHSLQPLTRTAQCCPSLRSHCWLFFFSSPCPKSLRLHKKKKKGGARTWGLHNLWIRDLYAAGMLYFFPTVTLYCHKLPNRQGYASDSRQGHKGQEQTAAGGVPRGEGGEAGHEAEIKRGGRRARFRNQRAAWVKPGKSACHLHTCACTSSGTGVPRGRGSGTLPAWWSGTCLGGDAVKPRFPPLLSCCVLLWGAFFWGNGRDLAAEGLFSLS